MNRLETSATGTEPDKESRTRSPTIYEVPTYAHWPSLRRKCANSARSRAQGTKFLKNAGNLIFYFQKFTMLPQISQSVAIFFPTKKIAVDASSLWFDFLNFQVLNCRSRGGAGIRKRKLQYGTASEKVECLVRMN